MGRVIGIGGRKYTSSYNSVVFYHAGKLQCVQKFWSGFEIWSFLRFFGVKFSTKKIDFSTLPNKTSPKGKPERQL